LAAANFLNGSWKIQPKYALNMQKKAKYAKHANKGILCTKNFIFQNAHPYHE